MADQSKNKWFPWRRLLRSTQTPRPETREVAVSQVTDKYSEYPSDGLTPVRLAEIFKEADAGDVLRQAELFEEMEEKDPHLFSQLQTRKNAVTGLDYEVIPFDSDDPRDKEIAEFVEAQIGGIEGFEDVMLDLLDAIGKGFAVSEIMWSYDEGHVVVGDIRSRHQKRFFWDTVDDSFKVRTQDAPEGILLPTRTWTFTRVNSAPTISGSDTNLGDKNVGFTYNYTVNDADGDEVTVIEKLNDEVLRTVNNAPKGEQLSVSITSEKLYALGLNTVNNLVISASDGQGGTTYRRLTFKRTNSAPAISGQDEDLGQQTGSFAEKYTVTDVEGDNVVVTEFIDDKQIRSYQATLGQEETIELSRENWLTLTNGAHQLRVEAVDGNFATSVRVWNFSKKETVIAFQFAKPEETDARATKILITPTWHIEGSVAKVEACNNAFDDSPAWEDITAQVAINRVYNFLNESKTAEKWGVNVRFTITKNEGYEEEVSISGFGGAYE